MRLSDTEGQPAHGLQRCSLALNNFYKIIHLFEKKKSLYLDNKTCVALPLFGSANSPGLVCVCVCVCVCCPFLFLSYH